MDAKVQKLIECFEMRRQYVTPLFQRPFAWKKDNWKRLWDDLIGYCDENDGESADGLNHFMGAVVVQKLSRENGVQSFWTIDGQQRLTTFSILLCALRDEYPDYEQDIFGYLTNVANRENAVPKMALGERDRDVYADIALRREPRDDSETSVLECYKFYKKCLKEAKREIENFDIGKIFQIIRDVPQIVFIELDDRDDPYLIFESLNDKGLSLSCVDLIRNFIMMKFKDRDEQAKVYNDLWLPLEKLLGDSCDEFFLNFVRKETRKKIAKARVYEEIKSMFGPLDSVETLEKINLILKNASYYYDFLNPEKMRNREAARELYILKKLKNTVIYPFLLDLYEHCDASKEDGVFVRCLRILTSYIMRRTFCCEQTVMTNTMPVQLMIGLRRAECDFDEWLEMYLSALRGSAYWPDDETFCESMQKHNNVRIRQELALVFLQAIERNLSGETFSDFEETTIEHILPEKTLTPQWRAELGANAEGIRNVCSNLFGNLTLSDRNVDENASFATKREGFRKSKFYLNRIIAGQYEHWSEVEIKDRAKFLADEAVKIWRRPKLDNIGVLGFYDDWTYRTPRRFVWTINGEEKSKSVTTWIALFVQVLQIFIENEGVESVYSAFELAGLSQYVARNADRWNLREALRICENFWVEKNTNSEIKRKIITKLSECLDISCDDWRVEL